VVVVLLAAHQFLLDLRLGVMGLHHSSPILESHQLLLLEVEAAVEVTRFHTTVFQVVLEVAAVQYFQMVQMDLVEVEILLQYHRHKVTMVEVEIINQDLVDWVVVAVVALELLVHQVLMDILLVLAVMVHHHQSLDHQ